MKDIDGLLERHVSESNAIENIFVEKNHRLFADHLAAAEFIFESSGRLNILTPESIHKILMRRELPKAGEFRAVGVRVGPYLKPRPEYIEKLMGQWKESLKKDIEDGCRLTPDQKNELAWHYHHWFEAIHPFVDGNGRTGRLILNNIRLLLGISWIVVCFSEREQYYNSIRKWEMEYKTLLEIK